MKKIISCTLAVVMAFVLCLNGFCAETTSAKGTNGMNISTVVPETHSINVTYSEGGYILLKGRICPSGTVITVNRFSGVNLQVVCKEDYIVKNVTINGKDVTKDFKSGTLEIRNVTENLNVHFNFEKINGSSNVDSKILPVDVKGVVYVGVKGVSHADLTFDFDGKTIKTNKNGQYEIDDITMGRHLVTIKNGDEVLANFQFVIERADVEETTTVILSDGTKKITIPLDATTAYIDFIIQDNNNDGIPDVNPDDTNPNLPPDTTPDDDSDNGNNDIPKDDGVDVVIGGVVPDETTTKPETTLPVDDGSQEPTTEPETEEPKQETTTQPETTIQNEEPKKDPIVPNLGAVLVKYPWLAPTGIVLSLLLIIILIIVKRKKNNDDENKENQ